MKNENGKIKNVKLKEMRPILNFSICILQFALSLASILRAKLLPGEGL